MQIATSPWIVFITRIRFTFLHNYSLCIHTVMQVQWGPAHNEISWQWLKCNWSENKEVLVSELHPEGSFRPVQMTYYYRITSKVAHKTSKVTWLRREIYLLPHTDSGLGWSTCTWLISQIVLLIDNSCCLVLAVFLRHFIGSNNN